MRMLIVDDSKTMRRFLSALASEFDIETEQAEDGLDGLSLLRGGVDSGSQFDVALVDWDMPRMTGIEMVRALRADAAFSATKVLMVTSHSAMEDVQSAVMAGADDFLMKPLDSEMFAGKLRLLGLLE